MVKNNIYLDFLKTVFIGLLSFCEYLANKYMPLNNEDCKTRTPHIDLNPVELNYYQFMVSLTLKRLGGQFDPPCPTLWFFKKCLF